MIIVYGTASSGKSNIAEQMAVNIGHKTGTPLVYLATMESETESARQRIKKHRAQREGKGFYTIEEPDRLSIHVLSVRNKTVLIECMSNYCANVYFKKFGNQTALEDDIDRMSEEIASDIYRLSESANELIIVTNDIFRDGIIYDEWTESYMKLLARVNERIAFLSDEFYEVVNGIPAKVERYEG